VSAPVSSTVSVASSSTLSRLTKSEKHPTFQEGPTLQQQPQEQPRQPSMPQIGAYQSNKPVPLLIRRRRFKSAEQQNRQESRAEARRWTLDQFARERAVAAVRAPMFSNDIFDSSDSILYNYNYCYWKQQFGDYDG